MNRCSNDMLFVEFLIWNLKFFYLIPCFSNCFLIASLIASKTLNFMQFHHSQTQLLVPKFTTIFILVFCSEFLHFDP
jgi:hypothetical protein